jgi:hypothetical protein
VASPLAKCTVFSFVDGLKEVAPGALFMTSVVGETMSVGLVKFQAPNALALPVKEHAHGEEASLQLRGGCAVFQGIAGEPPLNAVETGEGTVMIVPADQPHYGNNSYDDDGLSVRLNVVTPPRADYGSKGNAKVAYHPLEKSPA